METKRSSSPTCTGCFHAMHRLYYKDSRGRRGKLKWVAIGWYCPRCGTYANNEGHELIPKKPDILKYLCQYL